ncbi:MAG: GH3 family domain-containing protein, partial [Mucilaginibacter sp.]
MGLKAVLSRVFAVWVNQDINRIRTDSVALQQEIFCYLVVKAKNTTFGRDHHFDGIHTYDNFKKQVPIRDYEDLRPYIERVTHGEENILWPGKPSYLAKTSGTTS